MKNIHILPTDKPSRLYKKLGRELKYSTEYFEQKGLLCINQNIYITSDEKIKEGDWVINLKSNGVYPIFILNEVVDYEKKIILTTDQELIAEGVQAIDDSFLEWFVKNPSCEEVKIELQMLCDYCGQEHCDNLRCRGYKDSAWYKIIIPKEETFNSKKGLKEIQLKDPNTCEHYKEVGCIKDICTCYTLESKQETLEEAAERIAYNSTEENKGFPSMKMFIEGAKWMQERMYSEEDMRKAIFTSFLLGVDRGNYSKELEDKLIEQFKKGGNNE